MFGPPSGGNSMVSQAIVIQIFPEISPFYSSFRFLLVATIIRSRFSRVWLLPDPYHFTFLQNPQKLCLNVMYSFPPISSRNSVRRPPLQTEMLLKDPQVRILFHDEPFISTASEELPATLPHKKPCPYAGRLIMNRFWQQVLFLFRFLTGNG